MKLIPAAVGDWAACEPFLTAALAHTDEWQLPDVALAVLRGQVQLWILRDQLGNIAGSLVLYIDQRPRKRMLNVLLFGGAGDWMSAIDQLIELARENGCSSVTGSGRPGWVRKLGAIPAPHWEIKI